MSNYDSIDEALNIENTTETSIVGVGDKSSRELVVSDKTNDINFREAIVNWENFIQDLIIFI